MGRRARRRGDGHQAYVVTPLIEESDKLEVASAEETVRRLGGGPLPVCGSGCSMGGCRRPRRRRS